MKHTLTLLTTLIASASLHAAPDILIADFEGGNYADWKIEGEAFGKAPAHGEIGGQMPVTGFRGKGLVNSFLGGDGATGKLTSPAFKVERKYLSYFIGGGGWENETCLNLLVDGKVVRTATGTNTKPGGSETLEAADWDVAEFIGKEAVIQIVDSRKGGWGHINVDHLVQTDAKPLLAAPLKYSPPFNRHYQPTDYQEPYRPQFHFSPQNGWMNDINALWYLDGKYHMLYQWGVKNRDGAYASSDDLLHWTDHGLALIGKSSHALAAGAKQNVSGEQIYSGSGVVVSGPVAEKITGSPKSALIAIYTGTKVGTCIAWSNDQGKTWNNYDKNPVANPTSGADPRDPCVKWHEPTKKWVMAIYEEGTTFYGSKDLINWEKLSNIKFGFECPDLVELPLDGDPNNMKWVIYDAAGKYLVGHFDGTRFIDENQSKEDLFMDVGPDFYAGQSFFPYTLPQKKYIQIAWMDEWNGGIGEEPWERNATFPVELGLVTRDGKMRVTRTPIAAIKALYKDAPVRIGKSEVGAENILKDVRSKTFDLTLTFDLKGATAETIVFQIANVSYQYDITKQKITYPGVEKNKFGDKQPPVLRPDSNQLLKIRMLVDWSSIEIFSDGGVFSLSQQVAFDPKDDSLSLTANGGNVKLVNLELHQIKSIWR